MNRDKKQHWAANVLILLGVLGRLLPHPANITPVGAISLVGGAKLGRFWKWTTPFIALVLSDFLLGLFFHVEPWSRVTLFIYAAFAINILLGQKVNGPNRYFRLGALSLIGSLQFFILTNLGVWMVGGLYAKTVVGLVQCYTLALPYFGNTLLGDLCWSFGLFGLIDGIEVWNQKSVAAKQTASL